MTRTLSGQYALALIRLAGRTATWPGLLLHSRHLTWVFDPIERPLDDVTDLAALAALAGLHPIADPFAAALPPATKAWEFCLPTPDRRAHLAGPAGIVEVTRDPLVTPSWWSLAVASGGSCRMLVAACVVLGPGTVPGDPITDPICDAAAGGRVFGATITVRLYPEQPRVAVFT
jgi:hypothetical protein